MPVSEFERELEAYYEQHRNQELASRLEDLVQTMRRTLLLGAKYDELADESFSPNEETVTSVEEAKSLWEANQFERLEDHLPDLDERLKREENRVRGELQGVKHDLSEHLDGLESLNQRTNRISQSRIDDLRDELGELDTVSTDSDGRFAEQEQSVQTHVREHIVVELDNIEDELMEPFRGSGTTKHVHTLIDGDPIRLSTLERDEIDELQETLGAHLSLQLQGDES